MVYNFNKSEYHIFTIKSDSQKKLVNRETHGVCNQDTASL